MGWVLSVAFCAIGLWVMLGVVWGSRARETVAVERDRLLFSLSLLGTRYQKRLV